MQANFVLSCAAYLCFRVEACSVVRMNWNQLDLKEESRQTARGEVESVWNYAKWCPVQKKKGKPRTSRRRREEEIKKWKRLKWGKWYQSNQSIKVSKERENGKFVVFVAERHHRNIVWWRRQAEQQRDKNDLQSIIEEWKWDHTKRRIGAQTTVLSRLEKKFIFFFQTNARFGRNVTTVMKAARWCWWWRWWNSRKEHYQVSKHVRKKESKRVWW